MSTLKERLCKIRDSLLPVVLVWHAIPPEGGKAFWVAPTKANGCKCGWYRFSTADETEKYSELEDKISALSLECSYLTDAEDSANIDEVQLSKMEALLYRRDLMLKGAREVT